MAWTFRYIKYMLCFRAIRQNHEIFITFYSALRQKKLNSVQILEKTFLQKLIFSQLKSLCITK